MVSLISEISDRKGRRARAGWVCFDADCSFCTALARRFGPALEARGFGLAPLQDPRVQLLLALPPGELLREMRVLTRDGKQFGGADGVIYLASRIGWAWPLYAVAHVPGARRLLRAAYRWVAARRHCRAESCARAAALRSSSVSLPSRAR